VLLNAFDHRARLADEAPDVRRRQQHVHGRRVVRVVPGRAVPRCASKQNRREWDGGMRKVAFDEEAGRYARAQVKSKRNRSSDLEGSRKTYSRSFGTMMRNASETSAHEPEMVRMRSMQPAI
jgi:hypothetical protein